MLSSGNGRHRRPRPTSPAVVTVATAAATGAGIAIPLLGAATAQAADSSTWDRVAVCETGGLWSADTGNGFFGGLAITQTTWDEHGGDAYASRPDLASRAQQITVAERILADLGPDAWHGCDKSTGLAKDHGKPGVDPGAPALPGMPLPAVPGVPLPGGIPSGDSDAQSDTPTAPAAPTAPTAPATSDSPSAGSDDQGDQGTPEGSGGSNTDPGGAWSPLPWAPSDGATATPGTGTPGVPGATATTPSGGDSPSGSAASGRHAKPYSPTDEELAAADRASRTELYSTTGKDASGVPGASDTSGTSGSATPGNANKADKSGTSDVSRYTVDLGDTLSSIASGHHVDGGWHALYDANHHLIGDDPNLIKPGQILNLG